MSRNYRAKLVPVAIALSLIISGCGSSDGDDLPRLGADISQTTVSGLSAGAYMAGQFHLAHSRIVKGAGLVAGGPWACAQSAFAKVMPGPGQTLINLSLAINGCMLNRLGAWRIPNPPRLAGRARKLAKSGGIDALENIASDRIYIYSGSADRVVVPQIADFTAEFYRQVGIDAKAIKQVRGKGAGHAFVTLDQGGECKTTKTPFIVDCDYDQAGVILRHLRGPAARPPAKPSGEVIIFDQTEFTRDLKGSGLAREGALYVPEACAGRSGCGVHIVFHGCSQNRRSVGDSAITKTGYLRWADAHRVVVLFPQVTDSPVNPKGCWDWWGYTGDNFLTKSGPQIRAVRRMLKRLAGPRDN